MNLIVSDFEVKPTNADETLPADIEPEGAAEYLAKVKAQEAARFYPEDTVIGCDTVVILDGNILGKPKDRADAKAMIEALSGKVHKVITGTAVITKSRRISFSEVTEVEFCTMTEAEIDTYLDTDEPYDKAGAYGIQGKAGVYIKGIKGDYNNVVGLPVSRLYSVLKEMELI